MDVLNQYGLCIYGRQHLPLLMSGIKIYNLRIVPPNPVFNEVLHFKRQFISAFGKQPLSGFKPHITIAHFKMDLQYQDILLKVFDQLSGMEKFRLDIAGVEIFENYSKVLFLKVGNTEGIKRILEHLKILWSRDLHRNYGSLSVSDPPHMTISKTDGRGMLYDSLGLFQKTGFSKQIEVTHLTPVSGFAGKTWDWGHHIKLS